MSSALAAVDAERVTRRALEAHLDELAGAPVRLVAAGKAARGMAAAVRGAGVRVVDGVVTALDGRRPGPEDRQPAELPWPVVPAEHPVPGAGSEAAGRRAMDLARATRDEGGLLLVCLSGGASAMLAVPAGHVTMADKAAATEVLLGAGLPIGSMNLLRRQWSAIKGGRLAALAGRSLTLAISDVCVPGTDEAEAIGSGPTVAQPSGREEARALASRLGLLARLPPAIQARLSAADEDAVAPGDPRAAAAACWIVASRQDAMRAAAETARQLGYQPRVLAEPVVGPAREAWRVVLGAVPAARPACVIASGETVVEVVGRGRGGRNQELALAALEPLERHAPAVLASVGTDGIDGPTDAAGACVHSGLWRQFGPHARSIRDDRLGRNDSYPLLEQFGALLRTGPTGTNVGDLIVLLLPE